MTKTVAIIIGNSDDKLMQSEWHKFCDDVDRAISRTCRYNGTQVHGRFYALPNEQWQNACWVIAVNDECAFVLDELRATLAIAAREYRQQSIAWVEGATTFIAAAEVASHER